MGKMFIAIGIAFIVLGLLWLAAGKLGLFRLPGDIDIQGRNWRFIFPLTSSLILSVLLTLIFWIIFILKR